MLNVSHLQKIAIGMATETIFHYHIIDNILPPGNVCSDVVPTV